jgi:hypothetical protein
MVSAGIVDRGDPDYQWRKVATVPQLPADFTTWPPSAWHDLRIHLADAIMTVSVALRTPLSGNPRSCLITIRHDLFIGEEIRLEISADGKSAAIEQNKRICYRGPGGDASRRMKRY